MNLTFITGNAEKAKQLGLHLDYPVSHQKLDIPEIQSLDLEEIATKKAKVAYAELGTPVLVEDTSLVFHALGDLPGPLIKWFLESLANDGLAKLVDGYADRSCTASVYFALCDESGIHRFEASIAGRVANKPRGARGFGWDPIFIPDGHEETWGEMDPYGEVKTSMRKAALEKLKVWLENHSNE